MTKSVIFGETPVFLAREGLGDLIVEWGDCQMAARDGHLCL